MYRVFILSPARTTGKRASVLLNPDASFELAARLHRGGGATIGDAFAFMSGLYFRGKLAYAKRFGNAPAALRAAYVITSDAGLMDVDETVTPQRLRDFSLTPIEVTDPRYRAPLERTAAAVAASLPKRSEVVLLGSIATNKYVDLLQPALGSRLVFPREFVGRGDMSRGGLLLRAVQAETELDYAAIVDVAMRTGKRPPKLGPMR